MTRHLFRLIWNRKRANFLIMVEILCAFIVLEGVVLFATRYANNYRQPLGFSIDRVWQVRVDKRTVGPRQPGDEKAVSAAHAATLRQLANTLHDLPQVESSCLSFTAPYQGAAWGSGFSLGGRQIGYAMNIVTDDCAKVLGIDLLRGRWFSREDDGVAWKPIVVNESFARDVFGDRDPIGQDVRPDPDPEEDRRRAARGDEPEPPMRVIGVVREFRQHGEYANPEHYIFKRTTFAPDEVQMLRLLLIKLRPGTAPDFEETLATRLRDVARDWSFAIRPMALAREDKLQQYTIPLTIGGIVAGFLLLMVGLGLTGVVWQNVTQRIREIGLRRAKGARVEDIHRQILGELVVMTSLTLLVGVLLVAQLPLLSLPALVGVITPGVLVASVVISVVAIYLLTVACGWYPARLATRIQPAEALHYE